MAIYIDDRAGSGEVASQPIIASMCELTRLQYGDAMFFGNGPDGQMTIGVEVKSITDMVGSLQTGRLQATQIPGMLRIYGETWLLVYGRYRADPHDIKSPALQLPRGTDWADWKLGKQTIRYKYLAAFEHTLVQCGVHVAHVASKDDVGPWLRFAHDWWAKPWDKHGSMYVFDTSQDVGAIDREALEESKKSRKKSRTGKNSKPRRIATVMPYLDEKVRQRAQFLSAIPVVGYKRAVAAAKVFKTPREMMTATIKDWAEIDGFGPVIAAAVVRWWDTR